MQMYIGTYVKNLKESTRAMPRSDRAFELIALVESIRRARRGSSRGTEASFFFPFLLSLAAVVSSRFRVISSFTSTLMGVRFREITWKNRIRSVTVGRIDFYGEIRFDSRPSVSNWEFCK